MLASAESEQKSLWIYALQNTLGQTATYGQKRAGAYAINTLQSSYDNRHKWCLDYKCVLALAIVINYDRK
jgi:hypothetical protein